MEMQEYDFTLKFKLQETNADPNNFVEKLGMQGCDDALVGIGSEGKIALNFIRSASSAYQAIYSAIRDVKKVIPEAILTEAKPDLVGLTDVANLLEFSRQNMRKIMVKSGIRFPIPVYDGTPTLWHLADILIFMHDHLDYRIDDGLLEVAKINMNLNFAHNFQKADPVIQEEIKDLIA